MNRFFFFFSILLTLLKLVPGLQNKRSDEPASDSKNCYCLLRGIFGTNLKLRKPSLVPRNIKHHLLNTCAKFSEKKNLFLPLNTHTHGTCAYQGVRNISFLTNFAYVLNE